MDARGFAAASWVALVAWAAALVLALAVAGAGLAAAMGWSDSWQQRIELIPGTGLATLETGPSWSLEGSGTLCEPVVVSNYAPDCYGFMLRKGEQRLDGDVVLPSEVRAVAAELTGHVSLNAAPGWQPLLLAIVAMQALGLLVVALVLYHLWRILQAAAAGEPFAAGLVRRLRWMGGLLVAWEVAEPLAWLFLSPKAFDYGSSYYGPVPSLQLGAMEPGGPNLAVIAFGALLLLLAAVFRHGSELADEQRLTV